MQPQIWLSVFGPSGLFCIFGVFGVICYVFVLKYDFEISQQQNSC